MEKTVVQTRAEKRMGMNVQYVGIGVMGVLMGCIQNPIAYAFALFYISYFYLRDNRECKMAVGGILFGSLWCGFFTTYLYALGFTIFFIGVHVLRLWNKNIYRTLPYISALICIPFGLYAFGLDTKIFLLSFAVFLLMRSNDADYAWIQKRFVCTSAMYGVILYTCAYVISLFVPAMAQPILIFGGLLTAAFFCETKAIAVLLVFTYIAFDPFPLTIMQLVLVLLIVLWKREKGQLLGALLVYGAFVYPDWEMLLFVAGCGIAASLYKEALLPFHVEKHKVEEPPISAQSILKRQLQNFSSIFQSLSQYYQSISDIESQMLSEMALALKYSADTLKKLDFQENQKSRILKAMEGYQYDVLNFDMEEHGEGNLALDMDIRNINKGEIKQTLLPLLEVLTHEHLKISEVKHHRFTNGYHHITMENHVPFIIDAYADSQKNMFESSGDSFSIFRFRNTTICMISDGMGSGDEAAASSRLITNIFQRMVISGVSKIDSIRCINKLIQSDAYATLDVICYDLSAGKAYIFKSAACPTFLIRDGNLHEVSGSALPVGILSTMEPDCFVADLKEGDEYLMVSDGIFMDEIYRWMRNRNQKSAKEDCEILMDIIKEKQRLDDSTAVLSRIQKAPLN